MTQLHSKKVLIFFLIAFLGFKSDLKAVYRSTENRYSKQAVAPFWEKVKKMEKKHPFWGGILESAVISYILYKMVGLSGWEVYAGNVVIFSLVRFLWKNEELSTFGYNIFGYSFGAAALPYYLG